MPAGVTTLVALGWLQPVASVRNAVTLQPVPHAHLAVGARFAVLAPLYNVWDAMTLLPITGHIAIVVVLAVVYGVWRSRVIARGGPRTVRGEVARAAFAASALIAWYVVGAMMSRPMARLVVDDPDAVVVDFHSHTEASHDGRTGFTAERNREWHRSGGFDVAYISDHGTYAAVPGALANNPERAGDGTVLLPGLETRYAGQHLNVLGFSAESTYGRLPATALASFSGTTRPPGMLTIPANLATAARATSADGPIIAIELVDGSPRGLDFGTRRRAALEWLSDSLHAPVVAGSNNHGWGRTAPGWTVMTIPGWRRLTPRLLDDAILAVLASHDRGRIVVVERATPVADGKAVTVAAIPPVLRNPFRTLSGIEQLAWVLWTWSAWWAIAHARTARPIVRRVVGAVRPGRRR